MLLLSLLQQPPLLSLAPEFFHLLLKSKLILFSPLLSLARELLNLSALLHQTFFEGWWELLLLLLLLLLLQLLSLLLCLLLLPMLLPLLLLVPVQRHDYASSASSPNALRPALLLVIQLLSLLPRCCCRLRKKPKRKASDWHSDALHFADLNQNGYG